MSAEAGVTAQENALAFEEDRVGPPAQPGFAAGIAEKPPHPAKGAGDGAIFVAGKNRHFGKPNYTLPPINPCSNF